jgi:hypothetical protein
LSTIKKSIESLNQVQFRTLENSLFSESISSRLQDLTRILKDHQVSQISQFQQTMSESLNNMCQVPKIDLYINEALKELYQPIKFTFEVSEIINSLNCQLTNSFNSQLSGTIANLTDNLTRLSEINLNSQIVFPYDNIDETVEIVSDYIDDLRDMSSDSPCEPPEIESLSSIVSNIPRSNMASIDINTFLSVIGIIISIVTFLQATFDDSSNKQLEVLNKINTNLEFILENSIPD